MADEKAPTTPNAAPSEASFQVQVNTEGEKAQVTGKEHPPKTLTEVHEVSVRTDRVILDTSDPLAVQVPPKSEVDGKTPVALAYEEAKTPEEKLAADK